MAAHHFVNGRKWYKKGRCYRGPNHDRTCPRCARFRHSHAHPGAAGEEERADQRHVRGAGAGDEARGDRPGRARRAVPGRRRRLHGRQRHHGFRRGRHWRGQAAREPGRQPLPAGARPFDQALCRRGAGPRGRRRHHHAAPLRRGDHRRRRPAHDAVRQSRAGAGSGLDLADAGPHRLCAGLRHVRARPAGRRQDGGADRDCDHGRSRGRGAEARAGSCPHARDQAGRRLEDDEAADARRRSDRRRHGTRRGRVRQAAEKPRGDGSVPRLHREAAAGFHQTRRSATPRRTNRPGPAGAAATGPRRSPRARGTATL